MKSLTKIAMTLVCCSLATSGHAEIDLSYLSEHQQARLLGVEKTVEDIFKQLTLEEKISLEHASGK